MICLPGYLVMFGGSRDVGDVVVGELDEITHNIGSCFEAIIGETIAQACECACEENYH